MALLWRRCVGVWAVACDPRGCYQSHAPCHRLHPIPSHLADSRLPRPPQGIHSVRQCERTGGQACSRASTKVLELSSERIRTGSFTVPEAACTCKNAELGPLQMLAHVCLQSTRVLQNCRLGRLRAAVGQGLRMRLTPHLVFRPNSLSDEEAQLESVLDQLSRGDRDDPEPLPR